MLEVRGVNIFYGPAHTLRDVSMEVHRGEIVSLIGSNGAGKSTLLHVISGMIRPSSGEIHLEGMEITHKKPDRIVNLGISHAPEGRQLFGPLTVLENLELGAYLRFRWRNNDEIGRSLDRVFEIFPRLQERKDQAAGTLSGGEQQMLAIGRALMGKPKLLLLDEPSLGLSPLLVSEIFEVIQRLKREGVTVLLVEQNAIAALKIADRAYVMENGAITIEGRALDMIHEDRIIKAYLGTRLHEEKR